MLFDEATESSLRPWLIRTLQPICDADPGALTDYVIALLKHKGPEPEMRDLYISQLEEFLEKDAQSFVDSLLSALRTKSYLPYEPIKAQGQDTGIPIPLDALMSSTSPDRRRKRNPEDEDEGERRPPKGPRLSNDGPYSRRPQGRGGPPRGGFSVNNGSFHGRRRRICRDYYNTGFCSRGASCQYSHGEDAIVPHMTYPPGNGMMESMTMGGGAPFMPMFPGASPFIGMGGGTYDPHESHMEIGQGHSQRQDGHVLPGAIPLSTSELPVIQDLTPRDPVEEANRGDGTLQPNGFTHNFGPPRRNPYMGMHNVQMATGQSYRRSGKGTFAGDAHSFRTDNRDDKTLVVEKIPEEKLNLGAVNDWFKRFGTVTNVAIDVVGGKALVSFSNHEEAHAAWKSEEAVFGNRFVKLFWHRPLEGQGTIGQKALAASADLIKTMSSTTFDTPQPSSEMSSPSPSKHSVKPDLATAAVLAARQQLLEKLISEQKVLMSRLTTASTPEEKHQIMERIKSLQSSVELSTSIPSTSSVSNSQNKSVLKKEGLDEELDSHAVQSSDDGQSTKTSEESKNTAALKEKLAQLKAEASRLGLPEAEIHDGVLTSTSYRPYRGRGFRARGYGRGYVRGGPPRPSMKLDNRPRKLLIQDIPQTEEATLAVRTYYQDMGNIESFWKEAPGQVVIQFWTRSAAEHALASGSNIPSVGKVKISWHIGPAPSSTPIPIVSSSISPRNSDGRKATGDGNGDGQPESYNVATDVERDDGGWGQAFDDEDEAEGRRRRSRSRSFS